MSHRIDSRTATVINDLLREISSEMDLHYSDGDLSRLRPTIERMQTAATLVTGSGFSVPDIYHHIVARYRKAMN